MGPWDTLQLRCQNYSRYIHEHVAVCKWRHWPERYPAGGFEKPASPDVRRTLGDDVNLDIHKQAVGAIVAAGLIAIGLAMALLNGVHSSPSSDLAVSSKFGIWLSLATLPVGPLGRDQR